MRHSRPSRSISCRLTAATSSRRIDTTAERQRYRFDLKYIDFVGAYKDNGTAVTATNGLTTYLKDRGFVSLTFKTSF